MNRIKIVIIVFLQVFVYSTLLGQVTIQNGDFEAGSTATSISQIYKADFWGFGCDGTADLYDCESPTPGPPFPPGPSLVATPKLCINPRNNGYNNCRFGAITCKNTYYPEAGVLDTTAGESLVNELSGNLLSSTKYTISAYVARGNYTPVIQPLNRRIEAVLRTGNCIDEIIVPIPIDITFNNCEWMPITVDFQISQAQASQGFNFIEFRDASEDIIYHSELIFIDDVHLEGRRVSSIDENGVIPENLISIYPNPVKSELNIKTDIPFNRVVVMDLMGNVMFISTDVETIYVEKLSPGLYIVRLEDLHGNKSFKQKFVKQ